MNNKVGNKFSETQRESFTELLGQLARNSTSMVHNEIELVIQGLRETVRDVRITFLILSIGGFIILGGFIFFCAALFIKLTSYMPFVIAALVAGVILVLIGVIIVFIGYRQLKGLNSEE